MIGSLCSIALSCKGSSGVQGVPWLAILRKLCFFLPSQLSCHTLACLVPRPFVVEGDAYLRFLVFEQHQGGDALTSFVCMSVCFFCLPDVEVGNPGTPAAQLHYYVMLLFLVVLLLCFSCSCATPSSLVLISQAFPFPSSEVVEEAIAHSNFASWMCLWLGSRRGCFKPSFISWALLS